MHATSTTARSRRAPRLAMRTATLALGVLVASVALGAPAPAAPPSAAAPRAAASSLGQAGASTSAGGPRVLQPQWTEVVEHAPWSARAGLQAVALGRTAFVLGGRVPNPPPPPPAQPIPGDSTLLNDVWASGDRGATWRQVAPSGELWSPRAYFAAVTSGDWMYVLGGQDFQVTPNPACPPAAQIPGCPPFVSSSQFFDDVWRSRDGAHWEPMTLDAPWAGRAGLSAAVLDGDLYVFGGSRNDDDAVIGGPPAREYFNDVWRSRDSGRTWTKVADAPWSPRAGAATVVKDGAIYLLGGEVGFLCQPFPGCQLPYFNDVWRTTDGATWTLVTDAAGWSPRPGHKCEVLRGRIVCFGGFGLPTNPMDVWASVDGQRWQQLAGTPWNATSPDEVKYDFDTAVLTGGGSGPAIATFGGDRETFAFGDPTNYLRVDNDVWQLRLLP